MATRVGQIAERAGVAVDTLYATVGRKPVLLREVFETALSGQDVAVRAKDRDYVKAIRAAAARREMIAIYAAALGRIAPRMAPVHIAIARCGRARRGLRRLGRELSQRRARNMRLFAADLREHRRAARGPLR